MKKPNLVVISNKDAELKIVCDEFNDQPLLPPFHIHVYDTIDDIKLDELGGNVTLGYVSGRIHKTDEDLPRKLQDKLKGLSEDLPVIIGEANESLISDGGDVFRDRALKELQNQIASEVRFLFDDNRLTRNINLMMFGCGDFIQGMLRSLKDEPWANVQLFSPSTCEVKGEKSEPGKYSYEGIIRLCNLEEMIERDRLRIYNSLESWLDESKDTDIVIFGSGPHIKYSSPRKIRGKGSEDFYEFLFKKTYPKLRDCSIGLREREYSSDLWIESNPTGALCLAANHFHATLSENISSITCDGYRAAKLIARKISENPEALKRLGMDSLKVSNLYTFPVIGEHHDPMYLLDFCVVYNSNGNPFLLKEFFPESQKKSFRQMFRKELKEKATGTMKDSEAYGTGYSEAPETVARVLKNLSRFQLPAGFESVYIYDRTTCSYLMQIPDYDFDNQRFVPMYKINEVPPKIANRLKGLARKQKEMVERALSKEKHF